MIVCKCVNVRGCVLRHYMVVLRAHQKQDKVGFFLGNLHLGIHEIAQHALLQISPPKMIVCTPDAQCATQRLSPPPTMTKCWSPSHIVALSPTS